MASCEKCWADAWRFGEGDQPEEYSRLIRERDATGHTCTPEEQAGPDAGVCPKCGRRAMHQYCNVCMACGFDPTSKNQPNTEETSKNQPNTEEEGRRVMRSPEQVVKELATKAPQSKRIQNILLALDDPEDVLVLMEYLDCLAYGMLLRGKMCEIVDEEPDHKDLRCLATMSLRSVWHSTLHPRTDE